ncbi:sugar transferase [Streptomyces sp. NPDC006879]|uniref:sugar transferase n=1 Tax=Streptomyces sp. NPDC006879 TaxID=3364767 RepID=UPI0036A3E01C
MPLPPPFRRPPRPRPAERTPTRGALAHALRTSPLRLPRPPAAKRSLDLAGVLLLAPLAVPAILLLAAPAALRSRAGALVGRPCTGLGGRPFHAWTLRTGSGPVGSFLRRSGLDTLPRLLNVARGEMSLVGPRPLPPPESADHPAPRHGVRPGMTGLWQVGPRSDLPWEEMSLLDLHYAEHHWLGMDLSILARTPLAALRRGLGRPGQGRLSDTDHRTPDYSAAA